jgi:outer membrane protein insertion porin family
LYQPNPAAQNAVTAPAPQLPPVQQPLFPADSAFSEQSIAELSRPLPLDVITRETETGRLMLGVGVNSDAGLFGQITLDERNFDWTRVPTSFEDIRDGKAFRGAGEQFRLEAVPGTEFQRYSASFREPYLFNTDVSLMLSGYYFNRLYNEWTETRMGGKPGLGYQFTHELSGMVSVRMEQVTLTNPIGGDLLPATPPDIKSVVDNGPANVFGFEAKLAHDTRDSAFLPTQGHLYEITFEQVVGTYQYPHAELDLRKHFTLYQRPDGSGRHVLSLIAKLGVTGDETPVYDRYFAGGFSTIRGFAFRGVSPRYPYDGVAVGGDAEMLASAEYMFPITADDMLRGVLFCDSGAVEPTINHWTDAYRVAPGFGLRITVPALGPAPIALDLAFPVSTQPGDRISNFSFFIGIGK